MKRIVTSLFIVMSLFVLIACNNNSLGDDYKMLAVITNIGDKIEVDVVESEIATGPYWIITSNNTKFVDSKGVSIELTDLQIGDKVEILYGGQVMMSYPPQIVASKITIIS